MISVLACLLLFVVLMSAHGSAYVKVFLRKTALLHAGLFLILYILLESGIFFLLPRGMNLLPLVGSISGFLFAAAIEESTKHLSSVGLTAKEFRFSRKDLLIFIFFISLGFVCIENLLYLVRAFPLGIYPLIVTGVSRSLFGLLAHLFSASICVMFWWKALSYGVFSLKYILIFLTGFILASISHITFNLLVSIAPLWSVLVYAFIAYFAFTQWLILDES